MNQRVCLHRSISETCIVLLVSHLFLHQYHTVLSHSLCVLSHFSHAWLFSTLWTAARQPPLSMGFFRWEYWSGLPCPPPEDLPNSEIEPKSPVSPALQADSLQLSHQRNTLHVLLFSSSVVSDSLWPHGQQHIRASLSFTISPTQTHVHRVGDAIRPSYPLSSPSPPAPIVPSIRVFSNESAVCVRWPKYWGFSCSNSPSN